MRTKIQLLVFAAILSLLTLNAYANMYPDVYYIPATSSPPQFNPNGPNDPHTPYFDGQNYWYWWGGGTNNLGVYLEPGYYDYNPDTINRDMDIVIADPPAPQRPDWAIFDMESNGTYYFGGGYYNGHYFAEGYYLPYEIW